MKVKYCGVCMSEHYDWSTAEPGHTFGHEPCGTIAELGEGVTGFQAGDRVSGLGGGAMAEYIVCAAQNLVKVPDNIADEDATVEPLSCLVSAASKLVIPVPGDKVGVVGCGYMGCGMISLLKTRGAKVVPVDIRDIALEDALRFGVDEVYRPEHLPEEYLAPLDHIRQVGLNTVSEWGETADSLNLAIKMTAINGQLGIGAYHTGGNRSINVQLLNVKAVDALSTHERRNDFQIKCCRNAFAPLSSGTWKFTDANHKIFSLEEFDAGARRW